MALPSLHFDPFNVSKNPSSTSEQGMPPCQICAGQLRQPSFIGRMRDVFSRPTDKLPIEAQQGGGRLPSPEANWAELRKGDFRLPPGAQRRPSSSSSAAAAAAAAADGQGGADSSDQACLIAQNGMLRYARRGSSSEERFNHVWWVRQLAQPFLSSISPEKLFAQRRGCEPEETAETAETAENTEHAENTEGSATNTDSVPDNVVFPLCGICSRIARNYVSHWNLNHPYTKTYGYDILFLAFKRRLESLKGHAKFRKAFYIEEGPKKDLVICLGTAVVVLASPATLPFTCYNVPAWSREYPYAHYPSLPRWLLSKLKPLPQPQLDDQRPIQSPPPPDRDKPRQAKLIKTRGSSQAAISIAREFNQSNDLVALPIEILQLITSSLDRHSLFALRSTSIRLAWSLPLDQGFWFRELVLGGSGTGIITNNRKGGGSGDSDDSSSSTTTIATPPLFGFEPLNADAHTYIQSGSGVFGRIDAFSEIVAQFKPLRGLMFDPVKSKYLAPTPGRRDWRKYDWKGFVRTIASASEFLDGGSCDDAPEGFRARRWLWGQLDAAFAHLRRDDWEGRS